ncbi:MAG: hypothetical protein WD407_09255 [Rhodospirillales bacterium]
MKKQNLEDARKPKDRIEITPEMIEAGVAVFRAWEESVDYNDGYAAFSDDTERLVREILLSSQAVMNKQA